MSNEWKNVTLYLQIKTEVELQPLVPWTRYKVKLLVFNRVGDGPYSNVKQFISLHGGISNVLFHDSWIMILSFCEKERESYM